MSEKTMRVLMVVRRYLPWVGGTELQAQKLSAKLIELGVDLRVVTGWWFRGTPERETIGPVPVYRNFTFWEMFGLKGLRKFSGYTYILTLLWYLWQHRHEYDVIHIHMLNYHAFPAILAGHWWGKKTLIKMANSGPGSDLLRMKRGMLPGQRWMLPVTLGADRLVAVNRQIVAELLAEGVPPDRIVTIPNGVETSAARKMTYSSRDGVTVAFVGRLHPNKGVDILLMAFQKIVQCRPGMGWRLWLLGDGPLRATLEAQSARLGLARHVQFWGQIEDVAPLLAQADLFVLPSRAEGISNALLEAMACGLPCVASDIGGNADLIQSGVNGWLTRPESADDLAEALLGLGDDAPLRQRLGLAARRTIEANYSLDSVARRYLALYQELQAV